jgi:cytochrome c1
MLRGIKKKAATWLLGEMLVDLGTLVVDERDQRVSISIRRRTGKPPHLSVKWKGNHEVGWQEIPCTMEWAAQLERTAREMRKYCDVFHGFRHEGDNWP